MKGVNLLWNGAILFGPINPERITDISRSTFHTDLIGKRIYALKTTKKLCWLANANRLLVSYPTSMALNRRLKNFLLIDISSIYAIVVVDNGSFTNDAAVIGSCIMGDTCVLLVPKMLAQQTSSSLNDH